MGHGDDRRDDPGPLGVGHDQGFPAFKITDAGIGRPQVNADIFGHYGLVSGSVIVVVCAGDGHFGQNRAQQLVIVGKPFLIDLHHHRLG